MAIDTCVCDFVGLAISKIMSGKNRVKETIFTSVFSMSCLLQKNVEK